MYDSFGQLLSVSIETKNATTGVVSTKLIEYVNDSLGRRILKKVNGVLSRRYVWNSRNQLVAELNGNGKISDRYIYGTRDQVPDYIVSAGKTYQLVTDHIGSIRLAVEVATGVVIQQIEYDEFGQITLNTKPGFQIFGFAGGLYDPDTKLVRFGARDYDAETGRWTAKDPIGLEGGINSYEYAYSQPQNFVDRNGFKPEVDEKNPTSGGGGPRVDGRAGPITGGGGGGRYTTPEVSGRAQAPLRSTPNSIYRQTGQSGETQSRAFYDSQGRQFCRQDYKSGHGYNGGHEHNYEFNDAGQISGREIGPIPSGYQTPK